MPQRSTWKTGAQAVRETHIAERRTMLNRLAESVALACVGSLALAGCLLFALILKVACHRTGQTPAAAPIDTGRFPDDLLVIRDCDARVIRYLRLNCLRKDRERHDPDREHQQGLRLLGLTGCK